jgi:riboflavin kinase/FMN adenylyltransferase
MTMSKPAVSWSLEQLPGADTARVVTIGKFDGVHIGHREVIAELSRIAPQAEVTVVTFDRHPKALLTPDASPLPLVSTPQKVEFLGGAGATRVAVIPFTREFADLSPEDFARSVLADGLGATAVLVGGDFRYGHLGAGDVDTLRDEGKSLGFSVHTVADVVHDKGERISSTRIRRLLDDGDVAGAAQLLGRYHQLRSAVVQGHQRGRELGYPTANLDNPPEGFIPRDGVYATWVDVDGVSYQAATSIGVNPTFGDVAQRMVESHLFDFDGVLYGSRVTVHFVEFIRAMNKFPDAQSLADQMAADATQIKVILSR